MKNSIKKSFTKPVIYRKFIRKTGSGDKLFDTDLPIKVLYTGKKVAVVTPQGFDTVSKAVMYIDGSDVSTISAEDVFMVDNQQHPIKSMIPYTNKKGVIELWELYI